MEEGEPPLIQPPALRDGKVYHGASYYGSSEIMEWSGVQLQMGGPLAKPPKRGAAKFARDDDDGPPPKSEPKAGGAIRVGLGGGRERLVRLPHGPEDPRGARRRRRLPPTRALLPFDPARATEEDWAACAAGRGGAAERFGGSEPTVSVLSYQVTSAASAAEYGHIRDTVLEPNGRRARALDEVRVDSRRGLQRRLGT